MCYIIFYVLHKNIYIQFLHPTLSKIGNSALNRVQANCLISGFEPGSWPPNWLQGKAKISNPVMQAASVSTLLPMKQKKKT